MKFNNQTMFRLSTNQAQRLEALSINRPNKTPQELVSQVLENGLYHLEYRTKMNKKNADAKKLGREIKRAFDQGEFTNKAMREIGIKMGLIVDNEVEDPIVEMSDDDDIVDPEIIG